MAYDLPLLGSVAGNRCVHLQCHIGTDALSLARLGALEVVGIDFSSVSIEYARSLAAATRSSGGERLSFLQSDLYEATGAIWRAKQNGVSQQTTSISNGPISEIGEPHTSPPGVYDVVYTGVGALCWIPDIRGWARVIEELLRPGGRLFMREAHPVLWTLDEKRKDGLLCLKYPYFETDEPKLYELSDYVDEANNTGKELTSDHSANNGSKTQTNGCKKRSHQPGSQPVITKQFNHGMGEIIQALLDVGMEITGLRDHDSVPWLHISGLMRHVGGGEWTFKESPNRLPHAYTLQAMEKRTLRET